MRGFPLIFFSDFYSPMLLHDSHDCPSALCRLRFRSRTKIRVGLNCVRFVLESLNRLNRFDSIYGETPWHLTASVCFTGKSAIGRLCVAVTLKTAAFLTQIVVSSFRTTRRKKIISVTSAASALPEFRRRERQIHRSHGQHTVFEKSEQALYAARSIALKSHWENKCS